MAKLYSNYKILLVEENKIWQHGISSLLLERNIQLNYIEDSTETALQKIKDFTPDLVILDLASTQIDGWKIIKEIKQLELPTKTIIFSSTLCQNNLDLALNIGVEGICYRTDDLHRLERAIESVLDNDIYIDGKFKLIFKATKEINSEPIAQETTRLEEEKEEIPPASIKNQRTVSARPTPVNTEPTNNDVSFEEMRLDAKKKFSNYKLSEQQIDVFVLICKGKSNKEIAKQLQYSVNNIKYHFQCLKEKLNLETRIDVIMAGWFQGLLASTPEYQFQHQ
jgi:two-component system, NarL family, nitrate/nitrite response regulator NarL